MNTFIGVGRIDAVYSNEKVLKFNLSMIQEKPSNLPCLIFSPDDEAKEFVENLQTTGEAVWLQGKLISNEYDYNGKTIRNISIVTYPRSIKLIE